MFATLKSGGILMLPIIICALISIFIIIERCVYFYNVKKRDEKLMKAINLGFVNQSLKECEAACNEALTPTSEVIKLALDCRKYQEKDLREVVEAKMGEVVSCYEHLISTLGTIANISTLLGLLGTVTGNIKAFGVLGSGGSMGDPSLLASSIAVALVTTVAGLCVSIPSLIFHNFFVSRVNHAISKMESNISFVLLRLSGRIS